MKNCYCDLPYNHPSRPGPDFCAMCDRCGKPGHLRHHPGAVPFTGGYCDFHYRLTAVIHPLGPIGIFLWTGAAFAIVAFFFVR